MPKHCKAIKAYESYLVVDGMLSSMLDNFRYDNCFPATETDAGLLASDNRVLCILKRRSVNDMPATADRWRSFGCILLAEFRDFDQAASFKYEYLNKVKVHAKVT